MHLIKKFLRNALGSAIGALLGIVIGGFFLMFSEGGGTLVHKLVQEVVFRSYDIPLILRNTFKSDIPVSEVVIVYIDEESADVLKQPLTGVWDRAVHGQLLQRLKADGASAAVFDVVFTGDSPNPKSDEQFVAAIKEFGNVVLGVDETPFAAGRSGAKARSMDVPPDAYLEEVSGLGKVSLKPEVDLVVRRHPIVETNDLFQPLSWAAAVAMDASITKDPEFFERRNWLNYYGPPGWIPNVSYWRALAADELKPGFFRNKVVYVGSRTLTKTAGERKDEYPSPHSTLSAQGQNGGLFMPGVEVQATMFLNLVRNDMIQRMPKTQEIPLILALGAAVGAGLAALRPLFATIVGLVAAGCLVLLGQLMMTETGYWFAWTICGIQLIGTIAWSVVFNSWRSLLQNRLLTQSIAMYLSPSQAKRIARTGDASMLQPGAVKQTISILFSDIANFTTMSEGMDPDDLARLMNNYFESAVTHCIYKTEGTVVKFIGDAIFAIWNAPDPQEDHRERACRGAILLRDQVSDFGVQKPGLEVRTRIGLHCGEASVGNFGSRARVDFTAFGENVNLSSRMEGLNKYLGTSILGTGDVIRPVEQLFTTRFLGKFQLKGFKKAVEVFELIDPIDKAGESRAYREHFEKGLAAFKKRSWDEAVAAFSCVLEIKPGDGPSKFYLKQIEESRSEVLPADWDGSIELKEK
ncbi:MAG TPA: adenylate/guanylate cyclase domain-containing protein [Methylomirabilota bacterium]|nr:adenylate/guanylate cyclase domain-containing protein [Methylomirabilota bacterium]